MIQATIGGAMLTAVILLVLPGLPFRMTLEDLGMIHGRNERIATESYAEASTFYAQLIRNSSGEAIR